MFYSQDILQKRGGKFAMIWLAATKVSKLSRREVASVNVVRCCEEILAYVEERVAPAYRGAGEPRFSLYLSTLLMYGVVRIHSKLCEYLLNDASTILIRVKTAPILIDLQETPKADQVTNPELPLEDAQQAQEPYMAELDVENLRTGHVEPGDFWGLNGSPSVAASPRKKRRKAREEPVPQVASASEITLQEPPPMPIDTPLSPIPVPKDVELPMLDGQEMDQLMEAEVEERPLQVSDLLPTSTPLATDVSSAERQYLRSKQISSLESPIQVRQEDKEKTPERPPAEELPEPRAVLPSPGVTQITSPLPRRQAPRKSLDLELTAVLPKPASRKRKRQLAFADAETQIPKTKMKQNMATGRDTCEEFIIPDIKGVAGLGIFAEPGTRELRREPLLFLWRRNARFRRNIPDAELPPSPPALEEQLPAHGMQEPQLDIPVQEAPRVQEMEETVRPEQPTLSPVIPQQPAERRKSKLSLSTLEESVEELRNISRSVLRTPAPEISSIEIQRDASTSRIDEVAIPGLEESLQLDESRQSKKDKTSTRKRRTTRSSVGSDAEQLAPPPAQDTLLSATSLHTSNTSTGRTLFDVVEEPRLEEQFVAVPLLQSVSEDKELIREEILSFIEADKRKGEKFSTFRRLCPPELHDRKAAACRFTVLLGLCAEKLVVAMHTPLNIYMRIKSPGSP